MRHDAPASAADGRRRGLLPVRRGPGPGRLRDPGRSRARRAHRAGPLPLLGRRRDDPQDEGATVVRPQGHRAALRGPRRRRRPSSSPSGSPATPPSCHSLAYCLAVEEALGVDGARRGPRSCASSSLELERLYNHVADIGALCNDVGFGLVHAQALTLRERLLRLNSTVTGHRLLRGGVAARWRPDAGAALAERAATRSASQFHDLVDLARGQGTVMDRFTGTAVLHLNDVEAMGVLGVVGPRLGIDVRRAASPIRSAPASPGFTPASGERRRRARPLPGPRRRGRRVARPSFVTDLRPGARWRRTASPPVAASRRASGSGIVEGWRGTIVHRVELSRGRPRPRQGRRPLVLQLAGPRGLARRHDRARLPPREQELQPVVRGQRPVKRALNRRVCARLDQWRR